MATRYGQFVYRISSFHHSGLKSPGKKRLRISTNDLYCQKPELLTYIFAADIVWAYVH